MAIYTTLSATDFKQLVKLYNIGEYTEHNGIAEGSRNSTYKVTTSEGDFILTIFERPSEIANLKDILSNLKAVNSQLPEAVSAIANNNSELFSIFNNKHIALFKFVKSTAFVIDEITAEQAGQKLAEFHNLNIQTKLKNVYPTERLISIANELKQKDTSAEIITNNIIEPDKDLPKGLCHLDYFSDNLLYNNNKICGIIDWFMMGEESYLYDFCIGLCAWGFDAEGLLKEERYSAFYKGYTETRKLSNIELKNFKSEFKRAACRFLTTRLQDKLFPQSENTPILPPEKFINILKHIESE